MNHDSRHFQSLAVTILAIGTGALGFGLFGADYYQEGTSFVAKAAFLMGSVLALFYYSMLLYSVGIILVRTDVSGREVRQGPLHWMFLLIGCIAMIFIIFVVELTGLLEFR